MVKKTYIQMGLIKDKPLKVTSQGVIVEEIEEENGYEVNNYNYVNQHNIGNINWTNIRNKDEIFKSSI